MRSNWWLTALALLEMASLAGVLYLLIRRRLLATWPLLFINLAVELATNVCLEGMILGHARYRHYFYLYWGSSIVRSLLRLGVFVDILRTFEGIDFLPKKLYLFVAVAGLSMATASGVYTFHDGFRSAMQTAEFAVLVNRCVHIAWMAFAIVALASIKLFNFGWDEMSARIANGLFARSAATIAITALYSYPSKPLRLFANGLDSVLSIAIFFYWVYQLRRPAVQPRYQENRDSTNLHRNATALLALCSSRER
jgi:hypothetical protein